MKKQTLITLFSALTMSASAVSPYISKVYEFRPAPGQFINTSPVWKEGTTYAEILESVNKSLTGSATPGLLSLGAFGGYVVFGFDHPVVNVEGKYDFKVYGNAIISNKQLNGGSCEAGVVMVSVDENGNGLPDDAWYELAGSVYNDPATIKNFSITYYKPDPNKPAVPDPSNRAVTDMEHIRWTSNSDERPSGFVQKNTFHAQSYWPGWIEDDSYTLTGTLLPDNAEDISGKGTNYVLKAFEWGYTDNQPNADDPGFNIDWAVDSEGKPVKLRQIDFVKVHTGLLQWCGWIGETSTEVAGAEDLHPEAEASAAEIKVDEIMVITAGGGRLAVRSCCDAVIPLYNMQGVVVETLTIMQGDNLFDLSRFPRGVYVLGTSIPRKILL